MKRLLSACFLALLSSLAFAQISPDYIRHPTSTCTSAQYLQYTASSGTPATCKAVTWADLSSTTNVVGNSNLRQSGALAVIGRSANSIGNVADIQATATSDGVLRESGSTLGFGTIATAGIANNAVTLAKLATQADKTILSNISGGAAVPSANTLTATLDNIFGSTRGMILRREASAWAAYGLGSTGQALVSDGTDAKWGTVGGGAGGGLVFVGSAVVSGAAATNLSISGLDLDADQRYFILVTLKNATASGANINFFYNADTTATNYDEQRIAASSTTLSGFRANDAFLIPLPASSYSSAYFWLFKDQNTKPTLMHLGISDATTNMSWRSGVHQWRTTGTDVTTVVINSSVSSSLAIGSIIYVWKNPTS